MLRARGIVIWPAGTTAGWLHPGRVAAVVRADMNAQPHRRLHLSCRVFFCCRCSAPAPRLRGTDRRRQARATAAAAPHAVSELVIAADRRASEAGLAMLHRGGAPIDAAVAAQAVLGLVEPQASGFGGGSALLLVRDGAADGDRRHAAGRPHAARGLNVDLRGHALDPAAVAYGGGAVGVPARCGAVEGPVAFGKLPWADLFAPAIKLAEDGFAVPPACTTCWPRPMPASLQARRRALPAAGRLGAAIGAVLRAPGMRRRCVGLRCLGRRACTTARHSAKRWSRFAAALGPRG